MIYKRYLKRPIDFTISLFALILLSPVLGFVYILLLIFNKGAGAFFKQQRIGYMGCKFYVYKFKTMNDRRDLDGNLLPDIQRITTFGRFIRNSSIDELPQLWNVLKGDMSLIGPRPLLVEYLPLYSKEQMHRHDVVPGITGWAQVNGRNNVSWSEKFKLDVWYTQNITFYIDLKIFFLTVKNILKCESIESSSSKKYTMEPFNGNN